MKVALVHLRHAHTGGTERYLNQLARHLAERGDEVHIVCRSHEDPPHPAVRFAQLKPFAIGATWRLKSFASAVQAHVARADYDVVYGLGRTWSQDLLRLGGGSHATYLELAHAATRTGWKRLRLGLEAKHRFALQAEARAFAAPELQCIVVNARMVQHDLMRRYGLAAERFRLIYNGVDLQRFHPGLRATGGLELRRQLGLGASAPVVLFLGSGYARKGLDTVLEAFARARRSHPSAQLLVVGYDSAQGAFEQQARRLGLANSVHFLGGRRDAQVCYAAADLYLLPSRYDPFANTTLEALASGLPVLTSRGNGAHELLSSGAEGAVLDDPGDVAAWAAAIEAWLSPARLEAGRLAARRLAQAHSVASKMDESARLLEEVCASKRGICPP